MSDLIFNLRIGIYNVQLSKQRTIRMGETVPHMLRIVKNTFYERLRDEGKSFKFIGFM